MAFKRSGVRLPLSPPKKKDGISRPFSLVEMRGREALCKPQARKKRDLSATNGSGERLAQPIRSKAEDGVWVQTPLISTSKKDCKRSPFLFLEDERTESSPQAVCRGSLTAIKITDRENPRSVILIWGIQFLRDSFWARTSVPRKGRTVYSPSTREVMRSQ